MDMDIGEVNVVKVVLEEVSSSEGDSEDSLDEDSFMEKGSSVVGDGGCEQDKKEENVGHDVSEEVDAEHKVKGNEEQHVEGDEERQVEGDEDRQVEGDDENEHQVEGDDEDEHQVKGDDEIQVEGDEGRQVEGDEMRQVEGDDEDEHQIEGDEEFEVEEKGDEEDQSEEVNDDNDNVDFPMSSLKICYTMTLASKSDTSGSGDAVKSSSILHTGEDLASQTLPYNEANLLKEIERKDATIQEQEIEINALHDENVTLQKKLQGAMTCSRDLQKEINRFRREMMEMEFLQDNNEKDKRDQPSKANSPEISCSQQSEMASPKNKYISSILVVRLSASSDLEPPAAKKAKKSVSFNLSTEDPLNIRRSERIFLSTGTSPSIDADDDVQTEEISSKSLETENYVPAAETTASNLHGYNTAKTTGFFCKCGIEYASKSKLAVHVRKNSVGKMFQCAECNKKFYHGYLYRQHMKITHGVKTLVGGLGCCFCGLNFHDRGLLFKHQKIVHNISRGKSKRKFPKKPMKSGAMNTPAAIPFPVSKAPALATSVPLHQIDQARLSEGFFCICGYKSAHKFVLQTHVRYFSVERNFACTATACNHKSVTLPDLKSHMKAVHHITYDKRYGCRDCGSCFNTRRELFHHLAEVHDNGPLAKSNQRSKGKRLGVESPITLDTGSKVEKGALKVTEKDTCISAQAALEVLRSLKLKREIGGMSQQVVEMASKVSRNLYEENQVNENDEEEDPNIDIGVWNDADEDFKLLEIHPEDQLRLLEIETDDEDDLPLGEASSSTGELNASTLEHRLMGMFGEDSWVCTCGTKFQTERSLRSHMLLKSGLKPFKCHYCSEAFPRRDYLAYHLKRCHGEENETILGKFFTCRDCGVQLKSMKKLRAHKARMHQKSSNAAGMQLGQSSFAGAASTSRKRKYPQ